MTSARNYTDVNSNGQWDADMGIPGLGGDCQVVVYKVTTQWPLLLGLLADEIGRPITLVGQHRRPQRALRQ